MQYKGLQKSAEREPNVSEKIKRKGEDEKLFNNPCCSL